MKPLGSPAYGSIGHLPGSKLGPGDHMINHGQASICTEDVRDKRNVITVTEKLDGSCVSVARIGDEIVPLIRAGYTAKDATRPFLRLFHAWAEQRAILWRELLVDGERVCGEWLALAHSVRYRLHHMPFVAFDIIKTVPGSKDAQAGRVRTDEAFDRLRRVGIPTPTIIHKGGAFPLEKLKAALWTSGHGAIDPVEGAVYRVEKAGKFSFIAKFVRSDFEAGRFLPKNDGDPEIWNWSPQEAAVGRGVLLESRRNVVRSQWVQIPSLTPISHGSES